MADGGLTSRQLKALRSKISDPRLDPALRMQLKTMVDMVTNPQNTQEEQDRRWRNMCAYIEALPEKPTTLGGHRDILAKFGMNLVKVMSRAEADRRADFGVFMEQYGGHGLKMVKSYEMEGQKDAKPSCDECKKVGATMRCKQCGEWYCSRECQKAGWPLHKPLCKVVAEQRAYAEILDL